MYILRKFLSFAMALVTVFSVCSCQKENVEVSGVRENVAFTVLTGDIQTKALADASNIDILHYEVYGDNVNQPDALPLYEGSLRNRNAEGNFVMNISVVKEVTYHFVFWAQKDGTGHYDVSDLRKVKINNYANEKANDESRAAFFAYQPIRVSGQSDRNITVTLKRPFAQLNFGTSTYANTGSSLKVTSTKFTVAKVADAFNTLTGEGEGGSTVTFNSAPTPNGVRDESEKLLETQNDKYYWLGMNYLIVCGNQDNVTADAYFTTNKGTVHLKVSNVTIKENHRTNIVGDLLTTQAKFKIIVDKNFLKYDEDIDEDGNKVTL